MSLKVKALNGDTTFLLTFSPSFATTDISPNPSGAFTILIDPWITGPISAGGKALAWLQNKLPACISSLQDLPAEPDLVLVNQPQDDHCNRTSLCQLPPNTTAKILAVPSAAKSIHVWKHFEPSRIVSMRPYTAETDLYRQEIPALSPTGSPGEVTVASVQAGDLQGFHNAMGITYRAPSSTSKSLPNSGTQTISIIYSPHGALYKVLQPHVTGHLKKANALPLSALIHGVDRNDYPWWLGGNVITGAPGGLEIIRHVGATKWIACHDIKKEQYGWFVWMITVTEFAPEDVRQKLRDMAVERGRKDIPDLVNLEVGQEIKVAG